MAEAQLKYHLDLQKPDKKMKKINFRKNSSKTEDPTDVLPAKFAKLDVVENPTQASTSTKSHPPRKHPHSNSAEQCDQPEGNKPCVTIAKNRAKFPDFRQDFVRVKTFHDGNWEHEKENPNMKAENMSKAGFFFTGIRDKVRCYHCGLGLVSWWANDNPFIIHASRSPKCPHMLMLLGKEVMEKVKSKEITEYAPPQPQLDLDFDGDAIEGRCRICYGNESEILFYPCFHLVTCPSCALSCSQCPICRMPIDEMQRAYDIV